MADNAHLDLLHKVTILLQADLIAATLIEIDSAAAFEALPEDQRRELLPDGSHAYGCADSLPEGVKAVKGTAREIYEQVRADLNLGAPNLNVG